MISATQMLAPRYRGDPDKARAERMRDLLERRLVRDADGRTVVRLEYDEVERRLKERCFSNNIS